MTDDPAVVLNELAQGLRPLDSGIAWFDSMSPPHQAQILRKLSNYCIQAHPSQEDIAESIRRSGLRPTHTPAVLIARPNPHTQLGKIIQLPQDERIKSFRLLVALLGIADHSRRLRDCAHGCTHPWHHLQVQDGTP
ncbi:DUF5958 family protein [Actinomadura kijaniata]|uniref:DUF5958 family protein n=1 Tax=Actinomadura kijaniata TaxID=46161 RepID=UPI0008307037|nr:DUF5958 family protein [Actinomadura kijaniata]